MPNLLNVTELTRLLEAAPQDSDHVHSRAELQAHFLEEEAVKIGADAAGTIPPDRSEIALCVRQDLERIAKGEPDG